MIRIYMGGFIGYWLSMNVLKSTNADRCNWNNQTSAVLFLQKLDTIIFLLLILKLYFDFVSQKVEIISFALGDYIPGHQRFMSFFNIHPL